jgi:DNA repair exonuclease SbcCD ATPase subunit
MEFFLPELASECAALAADPLSLLSGRVSKLEQQFAYPDQGKVEELRSQARRLERVRQRIESLEPALESLARKQSQAEGLVSDIETSQRNLRQEVERLKRGETRRVFFGDGETRS